MNVRFPSLLALAFCTALSAAEVDDPAELNRRAQAAHLKRNLGDSTPLYNRLLALDPPAAPTAAQR